MKRKRRAAGFSVGEYVVYPSHGVGKIEAIESISFDEGMVELFTISIIQEEMTLRIPVKRVASVGLRKLTTPEDLKKTLTILKGRSRISKAMWSRRAQEYDQKINSGEIKLLTEVVRDLHRHDQKKEQSYSERQLYAVAIERLTREVAAVQNINSEEARETILRHLSARRAARK